MGSKNISISDEAYSRLKKLKGKNESFTDVINRLTNKATLLDLKGTLTKENAESLLKNLSEMRKMSRQRYRNTSERLVQ
jgi:predicted CopG family antitoxin